MPRPSRRTKREAEAYFYLAEVMKRLEWDLHNTIALTTRIPDAWHEIAQAERRSPLTKVTLKLEADVLRFFRSMGEGYGPRINDVLKSWMLARIAGVVRGAETVDFYRRRVSEGFDGEKPQFGAMAAWAGEGAAAELLGEDDATVKGFTVPPKARMNEHLQKRYAEEGAPPEGPQGFTL